MRQFPLLFLLLGWLCFGPAFGQSSVRICSPSGNSQNCATVASDGTLQTSSSGGGGAVTIADGADVAEGATTDAATTAGSTGTASAKFRLMTTQLASIITNTGAAIPAGTAIIGKVGIDQTTPGTTNGVQVNAALPAGSNIIGNIRVDQTTPGTTNGVQVNAALPAGTNIIGNVRVDQTTPGTTNAVSVQYGSTALVADPCQAVAKTSVPISQTTNTQLLAGTSAKKTYICSIMLVAADAENISLVAGTGSVCGTGTAAVIGGTTAAAGPNLASNGGFAWGSGLATIASGLTNADNVCLFQSASGRVAGVLTYVQQ